ncbi:MFS transporter [Saccharothrix algeriensis]|uniref:EmrB/QacA subfamily drug resistance transporter n=1 Tax=Saccharothrix algeriensis TaxID=173560 RepID=A0ABS2SCE1_9PSEU|nr:MFS transporter [Saccharothrix algeriensis]MBM7813906.1 EmrB/QacA subfamily drug resistance transporter [Saccharothrix algeriensis]
MRPAEPDQAPPAPRRALTALSLSVLLPAMSVSIANIGLPTVAVAFDAAFNEVQWVVIAYLLATTTLVVGVGRLGDLLGRRRLLVGGIAVFTLATLLCGLAPDLPLLIAARALQGVGAACMAALAMALVGDVAPGDRTGGAMGLLGTASAVGTALGPSLGGALVEVLGWRATFFACVPPALAALVLAVRALPAARPAAPPSGRRFDTTGMVLLAATLGAGTLAVTVEGAPSGPLTAGLLGAAAVGLALFAAAERRAPSPLVAPRLPGDPVLAAGLVTSALVSTVVMTALVVGPFHLTRALGLDPALVGLAVSAGPVVSALVGVPAGRAVDRFGSGTAVVVGLGAVLAAAGALAVAPAAAGVVGYVLPLTVLTAGYALFQAANNTAVVKGAPPAERGVVSGLLNLARNLGLTAGASVMGAVFASAAGGVTTATPAEVARGTRWTFAVAALLVAVGLGVAPALRLRARRAVRAARA